MNRLIEKILGRWMKIMLSCSPSSQVHQDNLFRIMPVWGSLSMSSVYVNMVTLSVKCLSPFRSTSVFTPLFSSPLIFLVHALFMFSRVDQAFESCPKILYFCAWNWKGSFEAIGDCFITGGQTSLHSLPESLSVVPSNSRNPVAWYMKTQKLL